MRQKISIGALCTTGTIKEDDSGFVLKLDIDDGDALTPLVQYTSMIEPIYVTLKSRGEMRFAMCDYFANCGRFLITHWTEVGKRRRMPRAAVFIGKSMYINDDAAARRFNLGSREAYRKWHEERATVTL